MGTFWQTTVYFPRLDPAPLTQLRALIGNLANAGLFFPNTSEMKPDWFSLNSYEHRDLSSLDEALQLTEEYQGGQISLISDETMMRTYLVVSLSGTDVHPETSADYQYGSITLRIDYAYLNREPREVIHDRYVAIFRWSNIIAQHPNAIFGWGEIQAYVDLEGGDSVPAETLKQWQIPRLSWWNYYSNTYVQHVGLNRLSSAGAWVGTKLNHGFITILRPPEEVGYVFEPDYDEIFG